MIPVVVRCSLLGNLRYATQKIVPVSLGLRGRRSYSSNSSEETLNAWIEHVQTLERVYDDGISIGKIKDLYCMLPTRSDPPPPGTTSITSSRPKNIVAIPPTRVVHPTPANNAPLDPVHALIFFYPRTPEALLGSDQTDTLFGPPAPFGRRMWAGGRFFWPKGAENANKERLLRMGRKALAKSRVVGVEKKGFDRGAPMLFVHQRIAYNHADEGEGEGPLLYEEERTHVYLPSNARADRRVARKGMFYFLSFFLSYAFFSLVV